MVRQPPAQNLSGNSRDEGATSHL